MSWKNPLFSVGDRVRYKPYGTMPEDMYGTVWCRTNDGTTDTYRVRFDAPSMSGFNDACFVAGQLERENPLEALSRCGTT